MNSDLYPRLLAVAVELTRQLAAANESTLRSLEKERALLDRQREGLRKYLLTRDLLSSAANAN